MDTYRRAPRQPLPAAVSRSIDEAWKLVGTWLGEDELRVPAVIFMNTLADTIRIVRDGSLGKDDFDRRILELGRSLNFDQALYVGRGSVGGGFDESSGRPTPESTISPESVALVAIASTCGRRELQMARMQNIDGVASLGAITSMPMPVCLVDQLVAQHETVH